MFRLSQIKSIFIRLICVGLFSELKHQVSTNEIFGVKNLILSDYFPVLELKCKTDSDCPDPRTGTEQGAANAKRGNGTLRNMILNLRIVGIILRE